MPRGGYRPGGGRPKGAKNKRTLAAAPADSVAQVDGQAEDKSPLEYMLGVMNDPGANAERRDRMAIAAAPYYHPRAEGAAPGKRQQRQDAAQQAGQGSGWGDDLAFTGTPPN